MAEISGFPLDNCKTILWCNNTFPQCQSCPTIVSRRSAMSVVFTLQTEFRYDYYSCENQSINSYENKKYRSKSGEEDQV